MDINPLSNQPQPAAPPPTNHHKPSKSKKLPSVNVSRNNLLLWLAVILALVLSVATAVYFNNRYNESQQQVKRLSNPTEAAKDAANRLLSEVGQLTDLPKGETPTIATVTDITKLKDQAFFVNAQNGDKVLIYTQSKKAILYRPSTNKIINIAPVNYGKGQASGTAPAGTQ